MKSFKQTYLLLSAQSYRIVGDNGEVNEGVSLSYIPDDNLNPISDEQALSRGQVSLGHKTVKVALLIESVPKLKSFPGLYDVTLEFSVVAQKQQIRVKDIDFVSEVQLVKAQDKPQDKPKPQ